MIFFWISALCLLLFVYPFVIYPRLLRALPRQPLIQTQDGPAPSFTLVFCAYNEEPALPEKIANLHALKARYPDLEILAYSDMSSDRTLEMLQEQAHILTAVPATERLGKAWGMRQLVAQARGDVIIFTDANVSLDEAAIDRLGAYFRDPQIGTVAGHLKYINQGDSATADIGNQYWSLEERIKALESQTGSTMGADGAVFARRRKDYPEVPPHLLDDLTASISPLFEGQRVISAPDVIGYERLTTQSSDEYRRKRRIACRAFNTHRHLRPRLRQMSGLDRFKYISHKLIRWFSPFALALAAVFFVCGVMAMTGMILGGGLAIAAAVLGGVMLRRQTRRMRKLREIGLALLATGQGIVDSLQGKTYQTWTPAQSRNI